MAINVLKVREVQGFYEKKMKHERREYGALNITKG